MSMWLLISYGAIVLSAIMIVLMIIDMAHVERTYSNEMLTSSREGELEASVEAEHRHQEV